jgi:hypothetical protein
MLPDYGRYVNYLPLLNRLWPVLFAATARRHLGESRQPLPVGRALH